MKDPLWDYFVKTEISKKIEILLNFEITNVIVDP